MTVRVEPVIDVLPVRLDGRLVGHVRSPHAGHRDEWELHPDQDELLYLVEGVTDVILRDDPDDPESERVIALRAGEACIVPKGAWHRQVVHEPSHLLFLSPRSVHRPYTPDDGWT
jgi:oxalate decarboxylase/phosphoglucose isomerase-like protein (cupin superfamily)